ncbi:hypothetical protein EVAR_5359_1 [Eumeta japonica]|uniref:Uncharacterized protein n=1 Tax=Eumeta variegata TaxID=151549 RepID=A0A4C1TMX6_EUMVA|nr:hypothetical protein EVAR_5359_1 [Eumeta japonica]
MKTQYAEAFIDRLSMVRLLSKQLIIISRSKRPMATYFLVAHMPPMDTRNLIGVTVALQASWVRIGYRMEGERATGTLTDRMKRATEAVTLRLHSTLRNTLPQSSELKAWHTSPPRRPLCDGNVQGRRPKSPRLIGQFGPDTQFEHAALYHRATTVQIGCDGETRWVMFKTRFDIFMPAFSPARGPPGP